MPGQNRAYHGVFQHSGRLCRGVAFAPKLCALLVSLSFLHVLTIFAKAPSDKRRRGVKSFGAWHSFPKILFDCTLKKAVSFYSVGASGA